MKKQNTRDGFSLMEMMVVLLIVAIIAAATAPMVTKKMMRNAGSGDSPWVFTGLGNNIAYNMAGANATAIIGAPNYSYAAGQPSAPRLVLARGNDANGNMPSLAFANHDGSYAGQINMDSENNIVTMNNAPVANDSVAIGMAQVIPESNITGVVAIGKGVTLNTAHKAKNAVVIGCDAKGDEASVAIGLNASTYSGASSIAIGNGATTSDIQSIAIGTNRNASRKILAKGSSSIAIGTGAQALAIDSIAIGQNATVNEKVDSSGGIIMGSVAIGSGARATQNNQIVLGTYSSTVYIPGNLVALGNVVLGSSGKRVLANAVRSNKYGCLQSYRGGGGNQTWYSDDSGNITISGTTYHWNKSDRRLKNVGEKYTAGLDELKKLDFYHYTFKKDEAKTPMVGVMAQDLQKVFPDAVKKGEDGFLRIRLEDMFYAVINAVKELDTKISQIVENVTSISQKVEEQQKLIEAQSQKIEVLEKQNAELQDEIKDIEKRIKKLGKKGDDALN